MDCVNMCVCGRLGVGAVCVLVGRWVGGVGKGLQHGEEIIYDLFVKQEDG